MNLDRLLGVGDWRGPTVEGKRRFGVPPGGAWDKESASIVRALLGQPDSESVFELMRGTAEFTANRAGTVACFGLQGRLVVDGMELPIGTRIPVRMGASVSLRSNLAYLGFSPAIHSKSRIDRLPVPPSRIRYLPIGEAIELVSLEIDPASSRAGVRLNGLDAGNLPEIPSEPTCVGAIQLTPSGQLIVIGPDGPTIGGYPKLGTVIEADLDFVARLLPGTRVVLQPIDWEVAIREAERRDYELGARLAMLATSVAR